MGRWLAFIALGCTLGWLPPAALANQICVVWDPNDSYANVRRSPNGQVIGRRTKAHRLRWLAPPTTVWTDPGSTSSAEAVMEPSSSRAWCANASRAISHPTGASFPECYEPGPAQQMAV